MGRFCCMAKLVYELNQSLDGYVDHLKMGPPRPDLFRHLSDERGRDGEAPFSGGQRSRQGIGSTRTRALPCSKTSPWMSEKPAPNRHLSCTASAWICIDPVMSRLGRTSDDSAQVFPTSMVRF